MMKIWERSTEQVLALVCQGKWSEYRGWAYVQLHHPEDLQAYEEVLRGWGF